MTEKQRANLRPWQPGQSGNPSGRPKTAPVREAFVRRAEWTLPDCVRDAIEKGGFRLPRRATFADALAAVIFAGGLKGNAACARIIHATSSRDSESSSVMKAAQGPAKSRQRSTKSARSTA